MFCLKHHNKIYVYRLTFLVYLKQQQHSTHNKWLYVVCLCVYCVHIRLVQREQHIPRLLAFCQRYTMTVGKKSVGQRQISGVFAFGAMNCAAFLMLSRTYNIISVYCDRYENIFMHYCTTKAYGTACECPVNVVTKNDEF